ncbi:hypothetical protein [Streptomyces sp. NBC_00996]|nr:hypothetical protein OG390_43015 [Streptomyces sp. NBC_00996]
MQCPQEPLRTRAVAAVRAADVVERDSEGVVEVEGEDAVNGDG